MLLLRQLPEAYLGEAKFIKSKTKDWLFPTDVTCICVPEEDGGGGQLE